MKIGPAYFGGRAVALAAVLTGAGIIAATRPAQLEVLEVSATPCMEVYEQLSAQEQQALTAHIVDITSPEVLWDLMDEEDRIYLLRTGAEDLPELQQESLLNSMFSKTLKNRTQTLYNKIVGAGHYAETRLEHILEEEQPKQKRNAQRLLDYWRGEEWEY